MTAYEPTSLARGPLLLLRYAESIGMDRQALMQTAKISPQMLADPDARVRYSHMIKLWRRVLEDRKDVPVGLRAGQSIRTTEIGVVGYAMFYSENLMQALERLTRHSRLLSEAVTHSIHKQGDRIILTSKAHASLLAVWHPIVSSLAAILTVAREITDTKLAPIEVHLQPPPPADLHEYKEAFRCPIYCDKAQAAIVFSQEQMQLPIKASDPALSGYLEQLAGQVLQSVHTPPETFVEKVRRALWYELSSGKPEVWRIARRLHISPRTLQRRLTESGTSFSEILEDLRRELSGRLLNDRKLAISEVAFLLGYSEPSAFQRAFRRWRGQSPRQYRSG